MTAQNGSTAFDVTVTYIDYPEPAGGWIDGVYHEREAHGTDECPARASSCRHFREKEETGWGVFDYFEGARYTFDADFGDYSVTASLRCSSASGAAVSVYCDGVRVMSGITLTDEASGVTFTVRATDKKARFWFSPDIPDGADEATAEICVSDLRFKKLAVPDAGSKPTVFLASDSTVQTYDQYYYPQTGWGEVFYKFIRLSDLVRAYKPDGASYSQCRAYELPDVTVENRSIGGRSARSFFLEGKFFELLSRAKRGDFIMIQFGHNDCTKARPNRYTSPDEYKVWITKYVRSSLVRGITPILVTPVMRRNCDEGGRVGEFVPSFPEFTEKLREISAETHVPLLDLGGASLDICRALGPDASRALYMHADACVYAGAYEKGAADNTHLSRKGALVYAAEAARLLASSPDERLAPLASLVDHGRIETVKETFLGKQH